MAQSRILVVDDEPHMLEVCHDTLNNLSKTEVVVEKNSTEAAEKLTSENWDVLIADIRMPGMNGVDLVRHALQQDPELMVLMLTAYPTVDTAVETMKLGASDYLTKPIKPDELRKNVHRLLEEKRMREENRLLRRQVEREHRMGEMIGKSEPIQKVFDTIRQVAQTDFDVLLIGETGTGKELAAHNIHRQSTRHNQRFVPVDCGAIPEELLESELFGHERGAFTGANERSIGLLEYSHKGTFFLDEIGQLPLKLQAKLLRVLQERKIRRVGGTQEIEVDVRIIAATSLDLEEEIRQGRFRDDLYYRINVARVDLPPLRERREDIALLTSHFIDKHAAKMGKTGSDVDMDSQALEIFKNYRWPGNIRQLENIIKRTLIMARGYPISIDDLPDEIVAMAGDRSVYQEGGFFELRNQHVAQFEQEYLSKLLETTGGDVSKAAEEAKIPRGTFYRLLKKNNIDPESFRVKHES